MSEHAKGKGCCLCGAVQFVVQAMSNKEVPATVIPAVNGAVALSCLPIVVRRFHLRVKRMLRSSFHRIGPNAAFSKTAAHLFYRLKENQLYFMPVGLFDEGPDLIFDTQVFIEEKPSYYCFANVTKEMTGAECFAEYGGGKE